MKNFRSKILTDKAIINLLSEEAIKSFEIEKILKLGEALTSNGSLAKLRDCFPLNMFTIGNSLKLFYNSSPESFFIFLVFGLWNEAVLNKKFSNKTRLYLLQTLLILFYDDNEYLKANSMPSAVSFKKSEDKTFILWLNPTEFNRIFNTIIVQIFFIFLNDPSIGLDRLGSHPTENYIGIIRAICFSDNRWDVIKHNVSRYEFINKVSPKLFTSPKRKRLNIGGCQLCQGQIDLEMDFTPYEFSSALLSFVGIKNDYKAEKWST